MVIKSKMGASMPRVRILRNAAHLFRLRVREQPLQELLPALGIAAGVALLFAVQISSTSVTRSVDEFAHSIAGDASIELAARGGAGMDQGVVSDVLTQPAVGTAAPIILQQVTIAGPRGVQSLTLVGIDERLSKLGGSRVRRLSNSQGDLGMNGLFVTSAVANAIGATRGATLTIESRGQQQKAVLAGTLAANDVGSFSKSRAAIAPLGQVQKFTKMSGRIDRVLVVPRHGSRAEAQRQLSELSTDELDVRPSDSEVELIDHAFKADQRSSALFSAIAVVVGLLFAFNAMLLSAPKRRRMIADLRLIGADRRAVVAMLSFDAFVLGAAASIIGILMGYALSIRAFHSVPVYLSAGFPVSAQHVVTPATVAISVAGGLAAAMLASSQSAFALLKVTPGEARAEQTKAGFAAGSFAGALALGCGAAIAFGASAVIFAFPEAMPFALPALFVALALVVGPVVNFSLARAKRSTRVRGGIGAALAVDELIANTARAVAIAVIVAGAVTAMLSIGGARQDLERGVGDLNRDAYKTSQLWVAPRGEASTFLTQQFDARWALERVTGDPSVRSVSINRGAFLDIAERRMRVYAPPSDAAQPLVRSQIVEGDAKRAAERIRSRGWVTLPREFANATDKRVGDQVTLPTPSGKRKFRVAAITANYGWPSGTIAMNGDDFAQAWNSNDATVLAIRLQPGVAPSAGKRAVQHAIAANPSLRVQTSAEMTEQRMQVASQGLDRLDQISTLVLGSSILAIFAAMFAAVWQRRARLASQRAMGLFRSELYRSVFAETAIVVVLGGVLGLAFGICLQLLGTGWTEASSGYKLSYKPAIGLGIVTLAKVLALAMLATIGPAYFAARIAPQTGDVE